LKKIHLLICFICLLNNSYSQTYIFGSIYNEQSQKLNHVTVTNLANGNSLTNDSSGYYRIPYLSGKKNTLKFEVKGYRTSFHAIPKLFEDEALQLNIFMVSDTFNITNIKFTVKKQDEPGTIIQIKPMDTRPSLTGDFMDYIKSLPGVMSNNELSSQYNVRGGSYDENLIYVNDIEVYRPQLVRSGQQEGLSFINPDLVSQLSFSAGGFEARYGDKLSSVLDVSYRAPKSFVSGFQIGVLGSSLYTEGIIKSKKRIGRNDSIRATYLIGARYRANRNVLNSLDAQGLYKSRFGDIQSLITYHFNRFSRLEFLTNYAQNRFLFAPEYQETSFGTLQSALRLRIGMDGQEIVDYSSGMGALSFVKNKFSNEFKIMVSAYSSNEREHFDIQGAYEIYDVNNSLGSAGFGDVRNLLGFGYFINHARNDLYFNVINGAIQGTKKLKILGKSAKWLWGAKYQLENIEDRFKEWRYSDSSGYNINPNGSISEVKLIDYINSKTKITNQRYSAFTQYQQGFGKVNQWSITTGLRYLYSTLNEQSLFSPRFQLYYEPNKSYNAKVAKLDNDSIKFKKNILLKAAFGYYYQAPFYREMRNFDGQINTSLKAQRSIHSVAGIEFSFKKFGRPFKFFAESYYKKLDYMVPYILDNVRIRYYADNTARGYAAGIDARVNGEFIKGLESWFTLSVLKTDEIIKYLVDSVVTESPLLRRPTDRRVSASIMFQDELKSNPDFRMHLMLNFGTGLPYYLGGSARYKEGNIIPAYRRVDIGFSKVIIGGQKTKIKPGNIKKLWVGVDVYNLLQINNVISFIWVKDFSNNTFGVPNYLTGRLLNARIVGQF
jgi:hypothetical protein